MADVFYMGPSAPLYTVIMLISVIVFMIVCKVDIVAFILERNNPFSKQIIIGNNAPSGLPVLAMFIFLGLSYAAMIVWWVQITNLEVGGYKINWLTSSFVISSIPIMGEVFGVAGDVLPTNVVQLNFKDNMPQAIRKQYQKLEFAKGMYVLYMVSLTALLVMSVLCLTIFYGPGQVLANVAGQFVYATAIMIWFIVFIDSLTKWNLMSNKKPPTDQSVPLLKEPPSVEGLGTTRGIIAQLEEKNNVKSIDLSKTTLTDNLQNYKNLPPLTFHRMPSQTFSRDVPENLFLHQMEREQLRPGNTGALDHKDFVAVQTSADKVLLMNPQKAKIFLEQVTGGELNFPRTGLLGHAIKDEVVKYKDEDGKEVDKDVDDIVDRETSNIFFYRVWDNQPGVIRYYEKVLGIGPGNGIFVNAPAYLPFLLTVYFLAVDIQIWRDSGYGLVFSLITNLPAFCFCLMERQRHYIPLMFLNRMLGVAAIVVAGLNITYVNSKKYLMTTDVLYDNSTIWMQNASYANPVNTTEELGAVVSVSFTSYFAFISAIVWVICSWGSAAFHKQGKVENASKN